MALKSLVLCLKTHRSHEVSSDSLAIAFNHHLSTLRGQSIFTSGTAYTNTYGTHLISCRFHYDRLMASLQGMYGLCFPVVSYDAFTATLQALFELNYPHADSLSITILCTGGAHPSTWEPSLGYHNGFEGQPKDLLFIARPLPQRPAWAYTQGIHCLTLPHQRGLPAVKTTQYLGGTLGQQHLTTLNVCAFIKHTQDNHAFATALDELIYAFGDLSSNNKALIIQSFITLLYCLNTGQPLPLSPGLPPVFEALYQTGQTFSLAYLKKMNDHGRHFAHETLFVTPYSSDPYLLEGATFSLLGIDAKDRLCWFPATGNARIEPYPQPQGAGIILKSSTIDWIHTLADAASLPYHIAPLTYSKLSELTALYAVSGTRINVTATTATFMPITRIDGAPQAHQPSATLSQLQDAMIQTLSTTRPA